MIFFFQYDLTCVKLLAPFKFLSQMKDKEVVIIFSYLPN